MLGHILVVFDDDTFSVTSARLNRETLAAVIDFLEERGEDVLAASGGAVVAPTIT